MVYYDGQHNDSRTNMAVALTSIFHGATAVNHTEVTGLIKESGKIVGAQVKDNISGESFPIFAKVGKLGQFMVRFFLLSLSLLLFFILCREL